MLSRLSRAFRAFFSGSPEQPTTVGRRMVRARYDAATTNDENRKHWQMSDGLSARSANLLPVRQLLRNRQRSEARQACRAEHAAESVAEGPDLGMVKAAVDQLAPMYREIVVLHYYNRLDYRRIAATLGVAGHTVRGRLFRARRQIERILRKNGYPER